MSEKDLDLERGQRRRSVSDSEKDERPLTSGSETAHDEEKALEHHSHHDNKRRGQHKAGGDTIAGADHGAPDDLHDEIEEEDVHHEFDLDLERVSFSIPIATY